MSSLALKVIFTLLGGADRQKIADFENLERNVPVKVLLRTSEGPNDRFRTPGTPCTFC